MAGKSYSLEYGNRCRQIRMAKGLSQQALAEKMNTTPQNVSKWERDGISNVDTLMQLSEVLGQDITADEIDQEGSVGEIGKEILSQLVGNKGYCEFSELVGELFGLPKDRVSNEIFKLERIGNVVREQYKDWLNKDRDGVFITAKGIITLKNSSIFPPTDAIQQTVAYEKRVGENINFSERIRKDEVSQLIWKLPDDHSAYRACYIDYLIHYYRESFPNEDRLNNEIFNQHLIPGVSCYFDTLFCMALGYSNSTFEITEAMESGEYEAQDWEEEQRIIKLAREAGAEFPDWTVVDAQQKFEEAFPWIGPILGELNEKNREIRGKIIDQEEELKKELGEDYLVDAMEEVWEPRFDQHVGENAGKLCDDWFTDEEIEHFIEENYKPAATDHEREVDELIRKIFELDPSTIERYYYSFPERWEKNGLAQKIRDVWEVPTRDEINGRLYGDEEEF